MAKKTIRGLVDDCAVLLQKLVRLKAADKDGYCSCVSCGTRGHWKEMQGGHFIERGKQSTKLVEENIHTQCRSCNGFGMKYGSAEKNYTLYMIDVYGRDFVDELIAESKRPKKFYRPELEDLKKELKLRVKELEQDLA